MYLLGAHLPDHKLVRIALTTFYGISYETARRVCARIQVHERATVSSLTEEQITSLSAYLSSPGLIPARSNTPTKATVDAPQQRARVSETQDGRDLPPSERPQASADPLRSILIEGDLRRDRLANIAHHRSIGTYKGRRHAGGFPVRGQRTQRNALTARRLNRLERRQYSTGAGPLTMLLAPLANARFQ
ncbi:hypothetical protein MVES1_002677 [Malassezia vespertilionis]|uniref:S13-like H2TH domain-containing protein n=1 Tax=Malassezia vespertilionis TaxID=2020962 RepID=A0A2N1JA90_9BASI|nr:uncharacterized protein MVES1_002677 [Malassezia vespertilionis]PKI83470.1 hypothetical protein MVES_002526 [Malassezia vespertilionis]WFD07314.1 hypothetical protein MVES1_002677 [Malassezia vespertilionis]